MTTPQTTRADHRRDTGSIALELAVAAPALLLLLAFVVYVGRVSHAHGAVEGASHDAARAASLARTLTAATSDAQNTAAASLAADGLHCRTLSVAVNGHQFGAALGQPGSVSVRVTCDLDLSQLGVPGVGAHRTIQAAYTSPLDPLAVRSTR